jgi:hypothetical protein
LSLGVVLISAKKNVTLNYLLSDVYSYQQTIHLETVSAGSLNNSERANRDDCGSKTDGDHALNPYG